MAWQTLEVPGIGALTDPLFVRVQDIPAEHRFPVHTHPWHQFIYAISGSLTVEVDKHRFVCGPEQAVWIPTGTAHEVASSHGAQFRSLYVASSVRVGIAPRHAVLEVTPLLRELIREASQLGAQAAQTRAEWAYRLRVHQMILAQLPRLLRLETSLPWPGTPMLRKLCEALYRAPADTQDMAAWGAHLGASERTLARRFQSELGISIREWKRRLRLFKSLELLGAGMSVTATALELGYGSPSAFTFMFTREMGYSPKAHLAARGRARQLPSKAQGDC